MAKIFGSDHTPVVKKMLVISVLILVLIIWQLFVKAFTVSALIFPDPLSVMVALYRELTSSEFIFHFGVTVYEVLAGFIAGSFFGFTLGVAIGQSRFLETVLFPYVVAFQTMPKVAVAPLFVVWFGFGVTSKVVITATIVFFPVLANTIVGLRSAQRDQVDLMTAFTATAWQILWKVRLPHALPLVFAGLDIGIVLAVIGAIVGEFVGATSGLGYLILQRNFSMDTAGVFAILIVLSVVGIVLHWVINTISGKIVFWSESSVETLPT